MKEIFLLESPRLFFREFRQEDAANLVMLNADPEVMRFTGDAAFASEAEAMTFVKEYDHYQRYGIGRWAVLEKTSETFLGWCGLKYQAESGETDVGFRFLSAHWNLGFATEAALACLYFGFDKKGLKEIVGRAARANDASIRVMEKLGMTYRKATDFYGMEGVCYQTSRLDFFLRNSFTSANTP